MNTSTQADTVMKVTGSVTAVIVAIVGSVSYYEHYITIAPRKEK